VRDLTYLLACDGVPVKGVRMFVEAHDDNPVQGLSVRQWRRLSRRTRRLLESGAARIENIRITGPLEFAPPRRRSDD
jgi:hypothetical protein